MADTCIKPGKPVRDEVVRVAEALLDEVAGLLANGPGDEQAVHAARTRLKRLRALARLVRKPIGKEAFAQANGVFRGVAQALGGLRDAKVRLDTLESLGRGIAGSAEGSAFAKELHDQYDVERGARTESAANPLPELQALLAAERERVASWDLPKDFSAFRDGLHDAWDGARRAWRRATPDSHAEEFHEWRKRAKDSMYHLEFLAAAWPRVLGALGAELDALADLLGADHDLHVLEAGIGEDRPAEALRAAIAKKRRRVRAKAIRLGAKLYADDARAFARRIEKAWEAES